MLMGMPETIEAEVIEIDGQKPPERESWADSSPMKSFRWRLDRRWWPLWVLLTMVGVVVMMTLGLVLGSIYLIFVLIRGLMRALFSLL